MKHITLGNGIEMPVIGFGVFQIPAEETRAGRHHGAGGRLPAHRHGRFVRQ